MRFWGILMRFWGKQGLEQPLVIVKLSYMTDFIQIQFGNARRRKNSLIIAVQDFLRRMGQNDQCQNTLVIIHSTGIA